LWMFLQNLNQKDFNHFSPTLIHCSIHLDTFQTGSHKKEGKGTTSFSIKRKI
jgi:hypothetical protein